MTILIETINLYSMKLKETKSDQKPTRLDELVSVPVDKDLYGRIRAMAQAEKRKPAQMGRILLEEAVEARESQLA